MANGHPVGAVVTGTDAMTAFRTQFRYFNTFGGNPVSCAAAMAVLDELEERDLTDNANLVGNHAQNRLATLMQKYNFIGNVRGSGLVFGAEMITDSKTKNPAIDYTDKVINSMRHKGIILSKLGRHKNTLKIRPPMPFSIDNSNLLFDTLDEVLGELVPPC